MGPASVGNLLKYVKKGDGLLVKCRYQTYKKEGEDGPMWRHSLMCYEWEFPLSAPSRKENSNE